MKRLMLIPTALLVACASPDYQGYLAAQQAAAAAAAQADTARYNALATIAKTDGSAAVAAAMALAMGRPQPTQVAAPAPNQALQWASIIVPAMGQAWAVSRSADVAINASNNASASAIGTSNAFVAIAGKIQAPVVAPAVLPQGVTTTNNTTTTTDSHDQTLSGTGTLGSGAYSTTDSHDTTSPVITPVVQVVPTVTPNVTPVVQVVPTVIQPVVTPTVP